MIEAVEVEEYVALIEEEAEDVDLSAGHLLECLWAGLLIVVED